jgi:hypothetical protein
MSSKIFMFLAFLCFAQTSDAQLMGRIMDRAKNKLERKIEEKIVEEISEEIARRAYRPVEKAIEDAARQKYQDSLNKGEAVDWEKLGESYAAFLNGLNKAANLPDQYHFDLTQEVEVIDYNKKRSYIRMYYSAKDPILGMENTDDDNKKQLVVIDIQRDLVVLYTTEKNGNKTGQALPGVLGLSSALSKNTADEYYTSINKTGKTKKIAGYDCKEFTGESKEELMEIYTTVQFPVNLDKTMGPYLQKFAPAAYYENAQSVSGMLMQSENTRKDDPTKKFSWTTKKVNQRPFEIKTDDYTFGNDPKE